MRIFLSPPRVRLALVMLLAALPGLVFVHGQDKPAKKPAEKTPPRTRQAWTFEEASDELRLYPRDAYLQYVALQLAHGDDKTDEIAGQIERALGNEFQMERAGRRNQVDLFSILTGALAVQESLQLDTMRGASGRRSPRPNPDPEEKRRKQIVEVSSLTGPTVKSHPWQKMLAGKKPDISRLAKAVPEDFYFVEFRSINKLLEVMENGDLGGAYFFNQTARDARTQQTGERLKKQLVLETNRLLQPFYDAVVDEVAIAGSDLFVGEGSDVTLLFRFKQPEVFKARLDGFLANAEKARPDVKRTTGDYLGIPYVHLATPERDLNVFAAYPAADLHVRSNSKAAFEHILAAIQGKTPDGKAVRRLGDSDEFAYLRTLMPRGAKEEDGLIYFSDPFIRRLVGPVVKLTERRRMLCYNHLRMIGHAALLYRTQFGKVPESLQALADSGCAPGVFGEGTLTCPDGGKYTLAVDGSAGVCTHHGHAHYLTPCCEIPVAKVNGEEADEYKAFLNDYNQYWRMYFDPIALRIQITPQRYRLETIVLPLIDNSIYTGLAQVLGGKPEPLDGLPVPKRNIFSVNVRLDKAAWIKDGAQLEKDFKSGLPGEFRRLQGQLADLNVTEFVAKGLGNQIGLHVYDAVPLFDFSLPEMLGLSLGTFSGRRSEFGAIELYVSFLVAALNAPMYVSIPVQDAQIVDQFLDRLDALIAAGTRQMKNTDIFGVSLDFYKLPLKEKNIRGYGLRFGPIKWRFFWSRIGNGLYVATKPFILEDLAAEAARQVDPKRYDQGPAGHALVRLRPQNWNQVLTDYRLAWAENNREACLNNLGPLTSVSRAFTAAAKPNEPTRTMEELGRAVHKHADGLHAVHFFCPEGGRYVVAPDGKSVECSVHGSALNPRQPAAPAENSALSKLLQGFTGMTATLTFLEDGLHAVVVIDRK